MSDFRPLCGVSEVQIQKTKHNVGCIDNGPKMAKIRIELCYFT